MRLKYLNIIFILFLFYSCSDNKKIVEKKFATIEYLDSIESTDSTEYKDLMINYGFYWQKISDSTKNIMFNNYNGKIIIFKNYKLLIEKSESDNVFTFDIDSINKYKLIGNYGFMERDTVMFWIFDDKSKTLIDDKGEKFIQIKVTK